MLYFINLMVLLLSARWTWSPVLSRTNWTPFSI